ncbi:hypothetical protein JGG61_23035 [Salmonella enterica subsp. enterica serovar London]|nr:hypothetical protein [Salmonella enterica subsp. enterica serovar London]
MWQTSFKKKMQCFKMRNKPKDENDREAYREAKRLARKTVAVAQENKRKELASELEKEEGKSNLFRIARQMARCCGCELLKGSYWKCGHWER